MNIGKLYVLLCVVLAALTIAMFWFVGIWWGIVAAVVNVLIAVALLALWWHIQRRVDQQFKSY